MLGLNGEQVFAYWARYKGRHSKRAACVKQVRFIWSVYFVPGTIQQSGNTEITKADNGFGELTTKEAIAVEFDKRSIEVSR